MALVQPAITLPMGVFCQSCGRRWLQVELWAVGEILRCTCGAPAYMPREHNTPLTLLRRTS